jgi:hypothetical protein
MNAARKRSSRPSVPLPWERRGRVWTGVLTGRLGLGLVLLVGSVVLIRLAWGVADRRDRERVTRASIAEVQRAVTAFRAEVGRCPRSTTELVHPPRAGAQYLSELPRDGWDRPLFVRCPGRHALDTAEVISAGPSGSFSVDDNLL